MEESSRPAELSEKCLTGLIQYSLNFDIRQSCINEHLDVIMIVTRCYLEAVCCNSTCSESQSRKLTLALKLLRNVCAGVKHNQLHVGQLLFIKELKRLIDWNVDKTLNVALTVICLQLLGNICVANGYGQELVWHECYPMVFCSLLLQNSENISNMCCMVLFNCIRDSKERMKQLTKSGGEIVRAVLVKLKTCETCTEWMVILLEILIETSTLQVLCNILSPYSNGRSSLLEFVLAYSDDTGAPMESTCVAMKPVLSVCLSYTNLLYLMDQYKDLADSLLTNEAALSSLYHTPLNIKPESNELMNMFVLVLRLVCHCSCCTLLLQQVQDDESVVRYSLKLLYVLSELDGSLDSAKNLSSSADGTCDHPHPLYGVKRDLVRLIGNICYHCPSNQNLVHDFIPLLLNQCNIDHRNPYIMQWGIWTIRNVCERNHSNQILLKQLELREGVNIEELKKQVGCEVEVDKNGKLRLKPTKIED